MLEPAERRRRVAAVVAMAERWLGREVRSVVDVGCGLGLWGREIARLRPRASYLGLDPSSALRPRRAGKFELRRGSFADLARLPRRRRFDLVLAVDVLHYLSTSQIDAALDALVPRARALLVLEVLTSAEPIEGVLEALVRRTPRFWRARFARHGLVPVGLHAHLPAPLAELPSALERLDTPPSRSVRRRRIEAP